jgi:hypothetical protein
MLNKYSTLTKHGELSSGTLLGFRVFYFSKVWLLKTKWRQLRGGRRAGPYSGVTLSAANNMQENSLRSSCSGTIPTDLYPM